MTTRLLPRRTRRRQAAAWATCVLATLGALSLGGVGPAGAELDAGSAYTAVARADALGIEYVNTAAPVFGDNPVIYGTPATAQSEVDSNGRSTAFAAAPYPGDLMVGLPDNANGIMAGSGFPARFPPYPFIVRSEYPVAPSAERSQSGISLAARSDQLASAAEARSGLITGDLLAAAQAQASSRAEVDQVTGAITVTADSRLDGFKVTDALQVGKSASHARIVSRPGQDVVKETSFTVASVIVNGVELGLTDQGFEIGDQKAPAPDPGPVLESLRQAGVTVEFLPATGTGSSVESAGLRITQVQDLGGQRQRVSLVLGRVSARIDGAATPADTGELDPIVTGEQSSLPLEGTDGPAPPITAEPEPATAVDAELGAGLSAPEASGPAAAGGAASPQPATRPSGAASPLRYGLLDDDASWFYTALAATAALVVFGSRLLTGRGPVPATPSVLRLRPRHTER
jgi:hypothetical protein